MEIFNWSSIFGLFSFIGGFIALFIAVYLSPHWKNISARLLALLLVAIAIWSMAYGMEFFSPSLTLKLWWVKIEYIGSVWVGVLLYYFILSITKKRPVKKISFVLLSMIPTLFVLLVLTNNQHHLMWNLAWIDFSARAPAVMYERGPGFWSFLGFSYFLIFIATLILIPSLLRARGILKKQLFIVFLGVLFPWVANIIYIFGFDALKYVDLTPAAFTISGITFSWGLVRYQMLSLIPLAHETLLNSMGDPVIAMDMDNRILDMNKAALTLCRIDSITPAHNSLKTFLPDLDGLLSSHRKNQPDEFETAITIGNESNHWNIRTFPLRGKKDALLGKLVILTNITGKKNAESALRESEKIQRVILDASPNPIVHYNEIGEVTYLNPAFPRIFGWTLKELIGKRINFVPKENLEETKDALQKTIKSPKGNYNFFTCRYTKAGEILDVCINSKLHRPKDGSPPSMVVNFTDITQIKKTERELLKTRNYIKSIINSLPSILIGLDLKGKVTQWNTQAEQLTGVTSKQALGLKLKQVLPQLAAHVTGIKQILKNQQARKETKQTLTINGKLILADIAIYPILSDNSPPNNSPGVVVRVDDVGEKVKIEEMMIQSEKMMSVGGLAAGMAHEINNPLAGIIQNTQVVRNRLIKNLPANIKTAQECGIDLDRLKLYMEKRKIISLMDLVKDSGLRAAHIVKNMLSFSRKSDHRKSTHYLHSIVDSIIELINSDYSMKKQYDFKNIEINRHYDKNIPPVICEKNKIQQVILNILKNGAEAMTEAQTAAPKFVIRCFKKTDRVALEIEDNGPGMDPEIRKRIFEPFFTTKEVGVGTGLGLSVSYFIITENHAGIMTVDSFLGQGAKFTIQLPVRQIER
ncbi:MAG: PAS domain S-box protein [Desulfobacula sp.]|nr:PAS domain S-box protein [Desulfobacula sp.]